jgi:hypothetical protein
MSDAIKILRDELQMVRLRIARLEGQRDAIERIVRAALAAGETR